MLMLLLKQEVLKLRHLRLTMLRKCGGRDLILMNNKKVGNKKHLILGLGIQLMLVTTIVLWVELGTIVGLFNKIWGVKIALLKLLLKIPYRQNKTRRKHRFRMLYSLVSEQKIKVMTVTAQMTLPRSKKQSRLLSLYKHRKLT